MEFTPADFAAFLGGSGNPLIREALNDPESPASQYFAGLQLATASVEEIDLLELCLNDHMTDRGHGLTGCLQDALDELLSSVRLDELWSASDRQWNAVSRPLRLAYFTEVGRQLAQGLDEMRQNVHSQTVDGRLASESTVMESDNQSVTVDRLEALRAISPRAWQIHMLTQFAGRSAEETAELTGDSVDSVVHIAGLARVTLDHLSEDVFSDT